MLTVKDPQNLSLLSEALEQLAAQARANYLHDNVERAATCARKKRIEHLKSCCDRSIEHKNINFNL